MKKILLSVAILAVAASCSKSEVTDVASTTGNAIGFSTLNDRVTKAANGNESDYTVYAAFDYSTTAETAWFINGETVDTDDEMSTVYFWPSDASQTLAFYAYAPAVVENGPLAVTVTDPATEALDLTFTVPTDADVDFTIAEPVTGAYCTSDGTTVTNSTGVSTSGEVTLKFSHMLSKATISVDLATEFAAYELSFTDIEFVVVEDVVTANAVAGVTGTSSGTDGAAYKYEIADSADGAASFTGDQELLFAPQTTTGADQAIKINDLTIYDPESEIAIFEDLDVVYELEADITFAAGYAYLFTITLDSDLSGDDDIKLLTITFSSSPVDWEDGSDVDLE